MVSYIALFYKWEDYDSESYEYPLIGIFETQEEAEEMKYRKAEERYNIAFVAFVKRNYRGYVPVLSHYLKMFHIQEITVGTEFEIRESRYV